MKVPNDFTDRDALEVLVRRLRERSTELALSVQSAIDEGKDEVEEPVGWRREGRPYRRTVRLSEREALLVAIRVLRAHLIEQPMLAAAANADFTSAAVGAGERKEITPTGSTEGIGALKKIEIEVRTETQISESRDETFGLVGVGEDEIRAQQENLKRLADVLGVTETRR